MKLNVGQYGFYRVQYPEELWQRLTEVAVRVVDDVSLLPEVEFAGLLDDAWALNDAGALPIHVFLNLTRYALHCAQLPCIHKTMLVWAVGQFREEGLPCVRGFANALLRHVSPCRALAARQVGEYLPWQVAGPTLVKIKNLLTLEEPDKGCPEAFSQYMLGNVTIPFVDGLSNDATFGLRQALPNAFNCDSPTLLPVPLVDSLTNDLLDFQWLINQSIE